MKAQIYVKSNDNFTAIVVSNHTGNIYFFDVLEVPELIGIQRGASFVKHQLDAETTEIFTDKLKAEEVLQDAYINWCRINAKQGEIRNEQVDKRCTTELQTFLRWNSIKSQKTR